MNIAVRQFSIGHYLKVKVNGLSVQTVNPRTKDWPKYDPDPKNCTGFGQKYCLEQGEHSFFNHSMDSYYKHPELSNLPEGFIEP